jgi:UDPglucose 6-dehydrogenase
VVADDATAELVKVSANAFLATKISFINAVGNLCDVVGADVVALADAIGHDIRIGREFLNVGIGFGGGCLPKDIRAFVRRDGELGVENAMSFMRRVDDINLRRGCAPHRSPARCWAARRAARVWPCWGASFKPDSDDCATPPPSTSPASCT